MDKMYLFDLLSYISLPMKLIVYLCVFWDQTVFLLTKKAKNIYLFVCSFIHQ